MVLISLCMTINSRHISLQLQVCFSIGILHSWVSFEILCSCCYDASPALPHKHSSVFLLIRYIVCVCVYFMDINDTQICMAWTLRAAISAICKTPSLWIPVDPQIFQKLKSHIQILGARTATRSKFLSVDPQLRSHLWTSLLASAFCSVHSLLVRIFMSGITTRIVLETFGSSVKKFSSPGNVVPGIYAPPP
jgi:hypothetical protein